MTQSPSDEDARWMKEALQLARQGWGRTSPNPLVGAVIVRERTCVGRGYHEAAGTPHAEVHALANAGEDAEGATLYVTLEPCCTHGRTPPCTQAIIQAGIRRVVIGSQDRNPVHDGRAEAILKRQGIGVTTGVLKQECDALNESFFWWIRSGRPFVMLKMAMTLDGRIATAGGQSKWITGAQARQTVQRLRQWADAIMVGGETVRRDNPALTVREPPDWPRQPLPCVWTSRSLPQNSTLAEAGTPILAKPETSEEWLDFLRQLGGRDVTTLLIEGGGELAASALRARIVNKVAFFIAPKILGGRGSRPVVGGLDPASLEDAETIEQMVCEHVGNDVLITGYCSHVHRVD